MADTTRPFHWGRPNKNYAGPSRARRDEPSETGDPMSDVDSHDITPTSDHYALTGESRTLPDGQVVHQIEAAVDLPDAGVSAGDVGGWVGPKATLKDKAWLSPEAMVIDKATLAGNARLGDSAVAAGTATVTGDAFCAGRSRIDGNAHVSDYARVAGDAHVTDDARVYGRAYVGGTVTLSGQTQVFGDTTVEGDEQVGGEEGQQAQPEAEHVPVTMRWLDGIRKRLLGRS